MSNMDEADFNGLQKAHWNNVRAILRTVDSLFALLEHDDSPPRQEVMRIAQDLIRDMKIKWQDEREPTTSPSSSKTCHLPQ